MSGPNVLPAFHSLYAAHHGWLRAWLLRKLKCRFHAEDIAHDAFLRLLRRGGLETADQPRALLATTANRLVIDERRRRDIEQAYLALHAEQQAMGTEASAEQVAMAVQALTAIGQAIERLPHNAAQAFLMSLYDGMSQHDIARVLRVSERSVKLYIAQALLACHDVLADSAPPGSHAV
ncbi:sigma-70 family RNA polymerase sigma factor [Achromobacter xylosoxidans]|uniref:sigma-70 family RNA polymerase sigma factor n=1 Tax=Alcaligenes xylosoxydans xylosoxydans TaxID=85698 RepID=UPI001F148308|nr:sigma-70 family RNA polymerase sigma factor [Achromobacter xylosoxidans]